MQHRNSRKSGIELLRIVAMLMIVGHHLVVHNATDLADQPLSASKVMLQIVFQALELISINLFFIIVIENSVVPRGKEKVLR